MKDKAERQIELRRLVSERAIGSQEEMVSLLRKRGFEVTQASISRDVRELGLVRWQGRYVPADGLGAGDVAGGHTLEEELITSCEPVGANLIVVRTPAGSANAVAVRMDRKQWPEIIGTIAGDDTIFIAVRSRAAQGRIYARLRASINGRAT